MSSQGTGPVSDVRLRRKLAPEGQSDQAERRQTDVRDAEVPLLAALSVPPSAHGVRAWQALMLGRIQRTLGNRASLALVGQLSSYQPRAVLPQRSSISVIQLQRNHDYQDNNVVGFVPAHVLALVQNDLDGNNVVYEETLGAGQATKSVNQMAGLKAQLRLLFQNHGHANLGGQFLGTQYALGPGIHIMKVWPQNQATAAPGAALQPLLRFKVAVIPHGQNRPVADAAGQAHTLNVQNNMTATGPLGALSNPFVRDHTCPPLPGPMVGALANPLMQADPSLLHQTVVAVFRQKASTLIELTPAAEQNLLAEVQTKNINNSYTTKQRFITVNAYTIHNFDPTAVPTPILESFVANFEYGVFHNPNNNLWQISHFEGVHNRANVQQLALATPGLRRAVARANDNAPTVATPVNNQLITPTALIKTHQVAIHAPAALTGVRVQIDDGDWKAATRAPANDPGGGILLAWTFDWDAWATAPNTVAEHLESRHRIVLEGENAHHLRTRPSTRNVRVMRQ